MAKQSVAVGGDATQKNGQEVLFTGSVCLFLYIDMVLHSQVQPSFSACGPQVVKKSKFKKKAKGSESTAVPEVSLTALGFPHVVVGCMLCMEDDRSTAMGRLSLLVVFKGTRIACRQRPAKSL
jgi:hypothetical protein